MMPSPLQRELDQARAHLPEQMLAVRSAHEMSRKRATRSLLIWLLMVACFVLVWIFLVPKS